MVPKLLLSSSALAQRGKRIACVLLDSPATQWPPKQEGVIHIPPSEVPIWMKKALDLAPNGSLALDLPEDNDEDRLILALGMILSRCTVSSILLTSERHIQIMELVLNSLELIHVGVNIVSCPTCGRCKQNLEHVVEEVKRATKELTTALTVAVMGCEVNGPGEARHADCGIAASARGGVLFRKGQVVRKLEPSELAQALIDEVFELCKKELS